MDVNELYTGTGGTGLAPSVQMLLLGAVNSFPRSLHQIDLRGDLSCANNSLS